MYKPFQMTKLTDYLGECSLDIFKEKDDPYLSEETYLFQEAVFANGRETVSPLLKQFQTIKDKLEEMVKREGNKFDSEIYLRDLSFKELENTMQKIFGFRSVNFLTEFYRYDKQSGDFYDPRTGRLGVIGAYTYPHWRYPIDGLVTDKGFYDSTHSLNLNVWFRPTYLRMLTAEEVTAIFLHELGHNLDPALVDIKYAKVSALSKYLTERKSGKESEVRPAEGLDGYSILLLIIVTLGIAIIPLLVYAIYKFFKNLTWTPDEAIAKIQEIIRQDKYKGDRIHNTEAFADNIARMYGFGAPLMSGLEKSEKYYHNRMRSRIQKEKDRQKFILDITQDMLFSSHKTDVQRCHQLIREYEADLKDPSIPAKVKKDIQKDLNDLVVILNRYLNEYDDFQNQINRIILEEINKLNPIQTPINQPAPVK